VSGISLDEARALLAERDLITVGARGDDERRRRHGARTTFVRVLEVHAGAIPASIPTGATPGEVRVVGRPASAEEAVAAVKAALAAAGTVPVTAFSLADLFDLAGHTIVGLCGGYCRVRRVQMSSALRAAASLVLIRAGHVRL